MHPDGCVKLEFGESGLLDHLVLTIDSLQFDDKTRATLAPHTISKTKAVPRLHLHDVSVEAGDPVLADHAYAVEIADRRVRISKQVRKQIEVFALLALDDFRIGQEGHDLVIAPKVERGGPDNASMRSICRSPSHTCQMRALESVPVAAETTKVPT